MSSHLKSDAPPVTRALAELVATRRLGDFPARTWAEATRSFVNWLGCAVGGAPHPAVAILRDAWGPFSGPKEHSVPGLGQRADLFLAAAMQGTASHVLDFDDTHLRTIVHPAGPVLAACVPLAEHLDADGARLIDALILGVEVECRVANAIYPAHYDAGWH
ncbi:MAG: MmgE/PrpD family protein, partial [Tagaea sp.]|nr:MmgE/PrpD family protein [Tagaea sp.]